MDIYFKKTSYGLIPLYDSDKQAYDKIHLDEEIKATITKPRNYLFHKKFFALLNLAFENQNQFTEFKPFRYWVTMKAGYVETITTPKGVMFLPMSISFGSMDEYTFQDLYERVLDQVLKLLNADRELIENELSTFM